MNLLKTYSILIALCLQACDFPKDPEHSWQQAEKGKLLIGIVHHPPFVNLEGGRYIGSEVAMIEEFAEEHSLAIEWMHASESQLIEMMKEYKLHVILGGFTSKTLWAKEVGITKPYDGTHVWLVARGENKLVEQIEKYFIKEDL